MDLKWSYSLEKFNLCQYHWFFSLWDLQIWWMTSVNKRVLFYSTSSSVNYFVAICEIKLELQSGNAQIGTKFVLTSVTLTFDFWPFAWTSLLSMVISPENFMMIQWQKHCEKGVTDRQTNWRNVLRAAWSQLKTWELFIQNIHITIDLFHNNFSPSG